MEVYYSKAQISNNIRKLLEEGKSNDDALDFFLMMSMRNDLGPERPSITKGPTPSEVKINLLGNDGIDKDDIKLELTNAANNPSQRLVIALWMIRQKQKLKEYLEGWDAVLDAACKKAKLNRIAFLGIQAIFNDAMKDYPKIKYVIVEQRRRARIRVKIPDSNLGVNIDAWWGSYKERLPKQIESLKLLLATHRKSCLKNFFLYHKK